MRRHPTAPRPTRAIAGGFLGTLAITLVMYGVAPIVIGMPIDIAAVFAALFDGDWRGGMILHLLSGTVVFPMTYILIFSILRGRPAVRGITWGLVLWLLAELVASPMTGSGVFHATAGGASAATISLVGHVAYGWLLGSIARQRRTTPA